MITFYWIITLLLTMIVSIYINQYIAMLFLILPVFGLAYYDHYRYGTSLKGNLIGASQFYGIFIVVFIVVLLSQPE